MTGSLFQKAIEIQARIHRGIAPTLGEMILIRAVHDFLEQRGLSDKDVMACIGLELKAEALRNEMQMRSRNNNCENGVGRGDNHRPANAKGRRQDWGIHSKEQDRAGAEAGVSECDDYTRMQLGEEQ